MKIHQLRFKNINSLAGEWTINFDSSEYTSNRIFAITGETASGKTTILDAICFALYGKTPRQDSISKANNEIMTRGTSDCFAELTFETSRGVFRAMQSQKRAYNKSDGALQQPKCSLADDRTGTILTDKTKEFDKFIVEYIGLNYDQFTKAVLLAQGSFNAFLKDDPDERAAILEKLSGSEIYAKISKATYEKAKNLRDACDKIESRLTQMKSLSEDERKALQSESTILLGELQKLEKMAHQFAQWKAWRQSLERADADCKKLERDKNDLARQIDEFADAKRRLDAAARADTLRDKINRVEDLISDEKKCFDNIKRLKRDTENTEIQLNEAREHEKQTIQNLEREKSRFENEDVPKLKEMRKCDTEIERVKSECKEQATIVSKKKADFDASLKALKEIERKRDAHLNERQKIDNQLSEFQHGEKLLELHSGTTHILELLLDSSNDGSQKRSQLDSFRTRIQKNGELLNKRLDEKIQRENDFKTILQKYEENEKNIEAILDGATIDAIDEEIKAIDNSLDEFNQFDKYIKDRSTLSPGKPCPLCGSLDHPGISQETIDRSIRELNERKAALKRRKSDYDKAIREKSKLESKINNAKTDCKTLQLDIENLQKSLSDDEMSCKNVESELADLRLKYAKRRDDACLKLKEMGESDEFVKNNRIKDGIERLKRRCSTYKSLKERSTQLSEESSKIENQYTRLKTTRDESKKNFDEASNACAERNAYLSSLQKDRNEKYADVVPDELEASAKRRLAQLEQQVKSSQEKAASLNADLGNLRGNAESTKRQLEKIQHDKDECEKLLLDAINDLGFDSKEDAKAALMRKEEFKALKAKDDDLRARQTENASQLDLKSKELEKLRAQNLTDKSTEEIDKAIAENNDERTQKNQRVGEIRQKFDDDNEKSQERAALQNELDARKAEKQIWDEMNALIGSADGKLFRNYAQSLTFERLLDRANTYLNTFSDRYLLFNQTMAKRHGLRSAANEQNAQTQDVDDSPTSETLENKKEKKSAKKSLEDVKTKSISTEGLSFCVVDNYQGGEMRTDTNLSGGESFIVSLALALGLSDMASKNVSIDTLFLDEGFGTLDENTLHTVIESLNKLVGNSSKILGVISHVEELKDAISTKITVTKLGASGRSRLDGPGVNEKKARSIEI